MKDEYLDFENIIEESKEFYKDFNSVKNMNAFHKEQFFRDKAKTISKMFQLVEFDYSYIDEMQIYYGVMGLSFELLIKICVLKMDWNNYVNAYLQDHKKRSFEYAKQELVKDLKNKISETQHLRIKNILDYIQLQRNNFLHNPLKGIDHYAMANELFMCVAVLIQIYDINISDELRSIIIQKTRKYDYSNGKDFEEVGLYEYVEKLKK